MKKFAAAGFAAFAAAGIMIAGAGLATAEEGDGGTGGTGSASQLTDVLTLLISGSAETTPGGGGE
ncbi:hypothetical protein IU431_06250 [Nocardia otitidiscaviarum]|uniref:hypothetical protein n=1 Tax=Nocardia otitidiscaviarum TaxID=1823 RepID=UPI0004A783B2|nr:hypothetical protein [Nocardia otitidiscaviarum]MBF6483759.1 hypothetical protein [Nocardia otitidiscaviarum]